ncbi:YqhR family membrane protein [Gracilibacillus sp. YIM 98692]|uniref:YqhR family membrane protein n=1 Tax=Gracilibacillus sp. YIM 98692 TaxID=2663532 RepID=UPI0013D4128A|nr:YqhR family membrane protein [Gracilibacillus sp. YIM 98692]
MRYQRRNQRQSVNQSTQTMVSKIISIGFFGGLIWSVIHSIAGFFNFTKITPKSFVLRSWLQTAWTDQWLGQMISVLIISILSIIVAFIYYVLCKKFESIWPGLVYGIALWFLLFWLLEPIFPNIPAFYDLDSNTIVTTICIFILYGVFVGYSISFTYHLQKTENS